MKFDWAKDFQCGKLLNMILQEDDTASENFDDPCDLKHLRFDSLDDDDHTLWIFAMLSRTRNGTRVLSFHHVLRVQNLLPITLRLTVLANPFANGGMRRSIIGSTKLARHDQEDLIEFDSPMMLSSTTTTHTTTSIRSSFHHRV